VLPPPFEQAVIVQEVEDRTTEIDRLVWKIRDGIDRLRELRAALISTAVTGKIDVRT
jgi:type I restriction enzyme S subunit